MKMSFLVCFQESLATDFFLPNKLSRSINEREKWMKFLSTMKDTRTFPELGCKNIKLSWVMRSAADKGRDKGGICLKRHLGGSAKLESWWRKLWSFFLLPTSLHRGMAFNRFASYARKPLSVAKYNDDFIGYLWNIFRVISCCYFCRTFIS